MYSFYVFLQYYNFNLKRKSYIYIIFKLYQSNFILVFYYVLPIISLTQVQCEYLESDRLICIIELFSKGSRLVSAHKLSCCVYDNHQKTVEYMHDNIPFMFDSLAEWSLFCKVSNVKGQLSNPV